MRKTVSKIAALMMAASMVLTACGGGQGSQNQGGGTGTAQSESGAENTNASAITDLVTYEEPKREQETFFILNSEKAQDLNVLANLYSPLLEVDEKGQLRPAVAKVIVLLNFDS